MPPTTQDEQSAVHIAEGGDTTAAEVAALAGPLAEQGRWDLVAGMLVDVARRALYEQWHEDEWLVLAETLRDYRQFGYARRLFRLLHEKDPDDLKLRQQYAFCVYKDRDLPAARRFDRALEILTKDDEEPLEGATDAETLGLAGAIYKRRWEVDAKVADLENALWCYSRGYEGDDVTGTVAEREYNGINAAFVLDQLASLDEHDTLGEAAQEQTLRHDATRIRKELVDAITARGASDHWSLATLGEALFGLGGRFDDAAEVLARVRAHPDQAPWKLETTATQLGTLARLRSFGAPADAGHDRLDVFAGSDAGRALSALLGKDAAALHRAYLGKVGLALSGGGYRASLFHLGVLAKLAERGLLRHVEVLSCVSGGSIVGAFYYLRLRELLNTTEAPTDQEYVDLVAETARDFLAGVQKNLRGRLTSNVFDNWQMMAKRSYSRTNRVSELLDELIYTDPAGPEGRPWEMRDLYVKPPDRKRGFSPVYENWLRQAKVPILVLNATTLNTGHNWQFTASWMGEPAVAIDEQVDANPRLRRLYYDDAPTEALKRRRLSDAVAASASVPGVFAPLTIEGLYDGVDVELVDGGVHDNQGVASLLDQDCTVVLVSDASGQMGETEDPKSHLYAVAMRTNSILMSRVRGAQYADLISRRRSGAVRRLMIVHLKKGLPVRPRDWVGCQEPYDEALDEVTVTDAERRREYRISESVQLLLAALRTDLDAFSDDEAYSLMAAGYRMTDYELDLAVTDFPEPTTPPAPPGGWPFAPAFAKIAEPASATGLDIPLGVGKRLFGRGVAAWVARRGKRRRERRPAGEDDERKGPAKRAKELGGRGAGLVVGGARAVVSAPLAVVSGLGTSGFLRVFRRRTRG